MSPRGISSAYMSRLEALKSKHSILNSRIEEVQKRPLAGDFYLTQLKKQRLLIREEIEVMSKIGASQQSTAAAST